MPHPRVLEMRRRLMRFYRLYKAAYRVDPAAANRVLHLWEEERITNEEANKMLMEIARRGRRNNGR